MKLLLAIAAGFLLIAAGPSMKRSSHAYGGDKRQVLDLYAPKSGPPAPVILFVHGGGWSAGSKEMGEGGQPAHFVKEGYAWASMNYRLVPQVKVEDQAADVARALAWLDRHAKRLGLDMRRLVVIAHSSGAQLAGLVGTDPQWMAGAGAPFVSIRGIVSLDGAGIDLAGIMAAGAGSSPFYANAFGTDVARQMRLSPFANLRPPDVPRWLLIHDQRNNQAAGFFGARFAEAGRARGLSIETMAVPDTNHMKMLRQLGTDGDPVTAAVDGFMREATKAP